MPWKIRALGTYNPGNLCFGNIELWELWTLGILSGNLTFEADEVQDLVGPVGSDLFSPFP